MALSDDSPLGDNISMEHPGQVKVRRSIIPTRHLGVEVSVTWVTGKLSKMESFASGSVEVQNGAVCVEVNAVWCWSVWTIRGSSTSQRVCKQAKQGTRQGTRQGVQL